MQVSVETLKGLERKVTVSVPTAKIEEEMNQRLKDYANKARINGFRPGKAPIKKIKQEYTHSILQDITKDLVQSTLFEALKEKNLVPAGYPSVEPEQVELGKDFRYSATFEIFPTIEIKELDKAEVEQIHAEISDADVDEMVQKLREQNKEWKEVKRAVEKGDKVTLNFDGYIDGEAFEGGKAEGFELEIGSGSMIPGFEDGLIAAEKDKDFDLKVTFPKDYGHEQLAGKKAVFKVKVTAISEGKLPKLDAAFAEKFNIKEGGIEALKEDIKKNMIRELERQLNSMNRERVFNKVLEINSFDLPMSLVQQEIEHMKHEMFHRIFGPQHNDNEKIPDFPDSLFMDQAKRRVHLGLLFSEYVKKHELTADKKRVNDMIEKLATAYDDPEELRSWYHSNAEHMAEVEALVTEQMVSEKMLESAKIKTKKMKYDEVMNPKKDNEKGA